MNALIYSLPVLALVHAFGSRQQGDGKSFIGLLTFFGAAVVLVAVSLGITYDQLILNIEILLPTLALVIAYWIGESTGWGGFFGAYVEDREISDKDRTTWWQFNKTLKTKKLPAALFRGLIWAIPVVGVCIYFNLIPLATAFAFAFVTCFVVSIPLARKYYEKKGDEKVIKDGYTINGDPIWELSEYIRGFYIVAVPSLVLLIQNLA